jgi:hypothetical protein
MGLIFSTVVHSESFDTQNVTPSDIRFGFVVHLPFRLRVGTWYRYDPLLMARGRHFTLWLRNRVDITPDRPVFSQLGKGQNVSALWTEAVLVVHNPEVSDASLDELRASARAKEALKYPRPGGDLSFNAMEALNHFIIGYSTATNELFGGAPLRFFRTSDFPDYLTWEVTILGLGDLTEDDARYLFNLQPDRQVSSASLHGELHDIPTSRLAPIQNAIALHQDFLFYEFAFEAKTKMVAGDTVGALLMAVAASKPPMALTCN